MESDTFGVDDRVDNAEVLRSVYARWSEGDFRAGTELYDPYAVLVLRPEFPEAGPHYGLDEIRRYMREDFLRDFAGATISGQELPSTRATASSSGSISGQPAQGAGHRSG